MGGAKPDQWGNSRLKEFIQALDLKRAGRIMEDPVDDHCLNMEGVGVPPPSQMMKDVLNSKVLKRHPRPIAGNNVELKSLDVKIFIEGKMTEFLPCPFHS
ncbi:hypothetical protein TNCT_194052 [Trichonephila clavata]|uniref:Uncharacterized protein n=1 Tax=Trichonephila clavata TaxID=2740835 RepID=A0A8X6LIV6_TRICU|nr:hypothetical protein TNCT_194052 [Trichonephila clavata]